MVTSHLGRPRKASSEPEIRWLRWPSASGELLGHDVKLVSNWVDGVSVAPVSVVLLENCRLNKGEKKNNEELARKMAALCDILYTTLSARPTVRRGRLTGSRSLPTLPALAHCWLRKSTRSTRRWRRQSCLLAIVAGSKVSTKLTILQSLAKNVDGLIVGGGIANTFMLAAGFEDWQVVG